jgi:hypothetical protein
MNNMLFQYDDACATLGSRGIIVGMSLAQNIMTGEVCCVTAKNDAVVGFTRPDTERLEESVLHEDIIPHFSPIPGCLFPGDRRQSDRYSRRDEENWRSSFLCDLPDSKNEGDLCCVSKSVGKYLS